MKAYRSFPFNRGTLTNNKGFQGTATGAVFTKTMKGYAIVTSASQTLSYSETPLPSGAFSVLVWAKIEGATNIGGSVMSAISDNVNSNYISVSASGNPSLKMGANNYRTFSYTANHQWHCYVFTLQGTANNSIESSALYVDGVSISAASTVSTGAQGSRTGWLNVGGDLLGSGKVQIANLKVFDAVLSENQIADLQVEFERATAIDLPKRNFDYQRPIDLSRQSEQHIEKLLDEVDLTDWTAVDATINSASTFTVTGVVGGVKRNLGLTPGKTYKVRITGVRSGTNLTLKSFDNATSYGTVVGSPFDTTFKFTATDAGLYIVSDGNGSITTFYSIQLFSYDGLIAAYSFSPKTVFGGNLIDISGNRKHLANTLCVLTKEGMAYKNAKSGPLNIGSVRSVAMRIKINSVNEKILEGAVGSNMIYVLNGILTAPSFNSFYVNGASSKIVETGRWQTLVLASTSYQSFAALSIGLNSSTYGTFEISDLRFYSNVLSSTDAANYHNLFRVPVITENLQDYMLGAKSLLNFYHTGAGDIRENAYGKYWYQSSAGTLETQSDQSNGEWIFSLSSVMANTTKFAFCWDGTNGYEFVIDTSNKIHIYEVSGGVSQEIYLSLNAVGSDMIDYRIVRLSNISSPEGTSINYPRGTFFIFTRTDGKWVLMETDPSYIIPVGDLYQTSVKVRFSLGLGDRLGLFNQFNQARIKFSSVSSDVVAYMLRVQNDLGYIDSIDEVVELDQLIRENSLTPSLSLTSGGYKASKIHAYVPTDGTGDLTVTRALDTGMRINKKGYYEPVLANVPRYDFIGGKQMLNVEELRTNLLPRYKSFAHSDWTKSGASIQGDPNTAGAELVINGDFSSATGWTIGAGWSIADGKAVAVATTGNLSRSAVLAVNKLYRVEFTVSDYVSGTLDANVGGSVDTDDVSANGTYIYYLYTTVNNNIVYLRGRIAFTGKVDNYSIKEVTGYASPFVDANGANLMSGYKLVEDTNNGLHYITVDQTGVIGDTFSYTFYAKAAERSKIQLTFQSAGLSDTIFDLTAVTATKGSLVSKAEINYFVDGWYKCTITATLTVTSRIFRLYTYKTSVSYLGDGTSGVLIAHAQLEAGATASSPIGGAEGSAQSRNADEIRSGTVQLPDDGIVWYAEMTDLRRLAGATLSILENASDIKYRTDLNLSNGNAGFRVYNYENGVESFADSLFTVNPLTLNKIAVKVTPTKITFFCNGVEYSSLNGNYTISGYNRVDYSGAKIAFVFRMKTTVVFGNLSNEQVLALTTI